MLDILDTAGQDEHSALIGLINEHFNEGHGFLLVYDITSRESFNTIVHLRNQIISSRKHSQAPMLLIGNKCDMHAEREVPAADAQQQAHQWGIQVMETSAAARINIVECFELLVLAARRKRMPQRKPGKH